MIRRTLNLIGFFLFEMPLSGTPEGRFPLTVLVDFHDANQYPFSALSGMSFFVGDDVSPNLIVKAELNFCFFDWCRGRDVP